MELKQTLTEEEIFSLLGMIQANLHVANKNLQMLIQKNKELEKKIASLENNTAQQEKTKKD